MAATERLTVAQTIVRYLAVQHSERDGEKRRFFGGVWGIWGHGNVPAMSQALEEYGAELPFYQPKNEQAMVHAAIGYAKATNRTATMACSASIGPGAANMLTGAATATVNRIPVLLLPSDYFASRRPGNVLQQIEHPVDHDVSVNDAFRPLSRFFDRITRPEQILSALPAAMRVLTDPADTGAVTLSLPQDVQGEALEVPTTFLSPRTWRISRRPPEEDAIDDAARLLQTAKRPMIVAGGGVRYSGASKVLVALSDHRRIPISETHAGKGLTTKAKLHLGGQGLSGTQAAAQASREADVVVLVGTRLSDFTTASRSAFSEDANFIHINLSAADAAKLRGIAVIADARRALAAIEEALGEWRAPEDHATQAAKAIAAWTSAYAADTAPAAGEPTQPQIFAAVNASMRAGNVVVAAAGTAPGEIKKGWRAEAGEEVFLEFGFSCMGHEIPAALGVRLARPDAGHVVAIVGDGTYLMAPTELVTAVQEGASITVVVIENGGYQCIRDLQEATTGLENYGNEFRRRSQGSPQPDGAYLELDYAANARSLGAHAVYAPTLDALSQALDKARGRPGPSVIVVPADKRANSVGNDHWWDLGVAQVSGREGVQAALGQHEAGRTEQKVQ